MIKIITILFIYNNCLKQLFFMYVNIFWRVVKMVQTICWSYISCEISLEIFNFFKAQGKLLNG